MVFDLDVFLIFILVVDVYFIKFICSFWIFYVWDFCNSVRCMYKNLYFGNENVFLVVFLFKFVLLFDNRCLKVNIR